MTRAKKIEMKENIIKHWHLKIIARGYFSLCDGDMEKLVLHIHYTTGYPKSKIKKYFWENIYTDEEFVRKYEC